MKTQALAPLTAPQALLFIAATTGGKYRMEVAVTESPEAGRSYMLSDYKSNLLRGVSTRNSLEEIRALVAQRIADHAQFDGIRFITVQPFA